MQTNSSLVANNHLISMTVPSSICCGAIFFRYCFKFFCKKQLEQSHLINKKYPSFFQAILEMNGIKVVLAHLPPFFFYKSHLGNAIFLSRFQTNPPTFSASCTIRQQCVSSAVHFKGGQVMALRMMGNPN